MTAIYFATEVELKPLKLKIFHSNYAYPLTRKSNQEAPEGQALWLFNMKIKGSNRLKKCFVHFRFLGPWNDAWF